MKTLIKPPLHKTTWASATSCGLYEARVTTHLDELDRDTNDSPRANFLYVTVMLDSGKVATESYYVGGSLKAAYELFIRAIKQADRDGFIPDSVAAFWAEPSDTSVVSDADGSPSNLITKDGTPIFSDGGQGVSFYCDFTDDGEPVFFIKSCIKAK